MYVFDPRSGLGEFLCGVRSVCVRFGQQCPPVRGTMSSLQSAWCGWRVVVGFASPGKGWKELVVLWNFPVEYVGETVYRWIGGGSQHSRSRTEVRKIGSFSSHDRLYEAGEPTLGLPVVAVGTGL